MALLERLLGITQINRPMLGRIARCKIVQNFIIKNIVKSVESLFCLLLGGSTAEMHYDVIVYKPFIRGIKQTKHDVPM